jgi:hypothetical protein
VLRFTSRIIMAAVTAVSLRADAVDAQIMRRPVVRHEPSWGGVSIGIAQGYTISDGATSATWSFGSGIEYAGRFERPTRSGIDVGIQGGYARRSLTYSGAECGSCDATALVTQLLGVLHYGQGYTFHPVYELAVGATGYSGFRRTTDQVRLGSTETDYDFKFSLGYGLGFGLSPRAAIEVVQEIGTVLHQKTGLAGSASNYPRVYVTRLGGKIAF